MALLGLYSVWIGRHIFPASLFLAFLACCAAVVLYCVFAELSVSAGEISQKTLFGRWRFRWEEIGSWTVRACPNSSDDLLFEAGSPPCTKKHAGIETVVPGICRRRNRLRRVSCPVREIVTNQVFKQ